METINIAVIGSDGVGKSAFIHRALRMNRPPNTNVNGARIEVEGVPHIVTLIELDLAVFDVDPTQQIRWPKQINGHMVPRIDGALILYDVMNKDSIRELPHTLCKSGGGFEGNESGRRMADRRMQPPWANQLCPPFS
jgi:GTPase SAR1 family protein